ncbi:hypothetical protein E4U26_006556 [Claviceps purpurea]|nr:hypothetical protein E4U26_006556 [Claviceps purpurea]
MTSTSKQATTPSEKGESLAQGEILVSNILPASFWFPFVPRTIAATYLGGLTLDHVRNKQLVQQFRQQDFGQTRSYK